MPCLGFPLCSGPLRNTTPQEESWPSPLKGASHPVTRASWLITNPQSLLELTRTMPTGWSQQHSHRCGMSVPSILLICCFLQATLGQERYKAQSVLHIHSGPGHALAQPFAIGSCWLWDSAMLRQTPRGSYQVWASLFPGAWLLKAFGDDTVPRSSPSCFFKTATYGFFPMTILHQMMFPRAGKMHFLLRETRRTLQSACVFLFAGCQQPGAHLFFNIKKKTNLRSS